MKYLYVLSSDNSDNYLEQTLMSITSLKLNMPDAFVSLLVDDITEKNLTGRRSEILKLVDEYKPVNIDSVFNKKARSRWLKTSMRRLIDGDFLYIDGDTVISDKLDDIDKKDIDIGAVLEDHTCLYEYEKSRPARLKLIKKMFKAHGFDSFDYKIYFNGGIIFCRDCKTVQNFFDEWHRLWLHCFKLNMLTDQASLNYANYNLNKPITELPGIWNCQLIHDGALRYIHEAKILHYFASNVHEKFFLLGNKEYTDRIRETGFIDPETTDMLKNPKSQFAANSRIILADITLNDFYNSATFGAVKRIFASPPGRFIEFILSAVKRHIFTPIRKKLYLKK
jgi:hypothetical protein